MKTADLTGPALDWAVAKAEESDVESVSARKAEHVRVWESSAVPPVDNVQEYCDRFYANTYINESGAIVKIPNYSTDWSIGGPIIEREKINLTCEPSMVYDDTCRWKALCAMSDNEHIYGPTPLIAAMRCYVASKLGDENEIGRK